jgi:hypothetical protein
MAAASREYSPALPLGYGSETVRAVPAELVGHNSVSWGMVVTGDRIVNPPMAPSLVLCPHVMLVLAAGGPHV